MTWTSERSKSELDNQAWGVPGPTFIPLTPFRIPAPAALVIETPVDQSLDFLGESLVSRTIEGPRIESESRWDPFPIERERFLVGRGELKDFVIDVGRGGKVGRPNLVGLWDRFGWGINSLEPGGELF